MSSAETTAENLEKVIDALESSITVMSTKDSDSGDFIQIKNENGQVFSKSSDEDLFAKEQEEKKLAVAEHDQKSSSKDSEEAVKARGYRTGVKWDCNVFYRRMMEDAHTIIEDYGGVSGQGFFGIYDGHGGKLASEWCSENYHQILEGILKSHVGPVEKIAEKMALACSKADFELQQRMANTHFGSTAVISFLYVDPATINNSELKQKYLITVNVGDARAVICRAGKAVRISNDHNAMHNAAEGQRIRELGGFVAMGRVNGLLAVTRSFGDFYLKPYVSVKPYSTTLKINNGQDKFIILACDGLWDVCDDQKAVDLIMEEEDPEKAAATLLQYALDNNSTDNLSIMVVKLTE